MATPAEHLIRRHRYTVDDFHRMGETGILRQDDRVELIQGEIVDMAPIGTLHAATVKRLSKTLISAIGDRAIVSIQDPIVLSDFSEPLPDIALLRYKNDYYASGHPHVEDILLVIEVADSSLRYDREIKLPLYASHGIPHAWLVDLENKCLTAYSQPQTGLYGRCGPATARNHVELPGVPGVHVDLSMLF